MRDTQTINEHILKVTKMREMQMEQIMQLKSSL